MPSFVILFTNRLKYLLKGQDSSSNHFRKKYQLNLVRFQAMSRREFPNPYADYNGEIVFGEDKKLEARFIKALKDNVDKLLSKLQEGLEHEKRKDFSIYTGQTGIAMLYLHLYQVLIGSPDREQYLEAAIAYLEPALKHLKSDVYTFLCGDAGILAVAAVAYARLGAGDSRSGISKECLSKLEALCSHVCKDRRMPDEHLYGRAGYLAAIMYVQKHLGQDALKSDVIVQVATVMLESGQALSHKEKWKHPLMYSWYNEYYLGAAHGLSGIFYTLLLVREPKIRSQIEKLVKPCVDYMLSLKFPSGNYPAVVDDSDDKLVHWCHGAPGWVYMFALAYQTYGDKKYLEAAERCCDVTWERGLLKKGYGLCHGPAGNAYAFLVVFRLTKNQKYLYRACKFAEWCFDYGKHGCRIPDTPFSLFEGMAGTVYFLADLMDPLNARFPGFEF